MSTENIITAIVFSVILIWLAAGVMRIAGPPLLVILACLIPAAIIVSVIYGLTHVTKCQVRNT